MSDGIKLCRCKVDDIPAIVKLSSDLSEEGLVNALKEEELQEAVTGAYIIVAKIKAAGEIVGFAVSSYSWGKLHIEEIGVRRDMRAKGIGKKILADLVRHAKKKNLPEVYCEIKEKNIPSLKLFSGFGFKQRLHVDLGADAFYGLYLPLEI